jgi:anaerobic dimethyl sulfoxide reductase subunit B (iron-sulfur subunit)
MSRIGFYFDQTRCTGCYTCVVACKDFYDVEAGRTGYLRVLSIEKGVFPDLFVAYLFSPCWHCEDPPCLKACPAGAITQREKDGIVVVDPGRCLGRDQCPEKCKKACPWDAPQFGPQGDAKMEKCQLCLERWEEGRKPVCVEACPLLALDAGPLEELHKKYGEGQGAVGFKPLWRFRPSVVFKGKKPPAPY